MKQGVMFFSLLLLVGMTSPALAIGNFTEGFSGLIIWVFLAYCGIIVVAQLFSALYAIGNLLNDLAGGKPKTRKMSLR